MKTVSISKNPGWVIDAVEITDENVLRAASDIAILHNGGYPPGEWLMSPTEAWFKYLVESMKEGAHGYYISVNGGPPAAYGVSVNGKIVVLVGRSVEFDVLTKLLEHRAAPPVLPVTAAVQMPIPTQPTVQM